jgi:hypothetical protein
VKKYILSAAALLVFTTAFAQAPEYQVKAAMLYKFAVFVEWPSEAFSAATSPFVVCILGDDPFGPWLQQEMGETRIGPHPVEIRQLGSNRPGGQCHLVFVSRSEEPHLKQLLASISGTGQLIVSDVPDIGEFCRDGGMVGLVMDSGRVRFEVNSSAADRAGLKIDSRLKRIATSADCGGK